MVFHMLCCTVTVMWCFTQVAVRHEPGAPSFTHT